MLANLLCCVYGLVIIADVFSEDKFFLHPHTLFLHPHIIFLFHSCPSWNYINTPILIKPISFPTGWPSHPVYIFWKWEPDAPLIRFTISKNCKPDGLVIWLSKKIQTGRPHPVLNPADRKIFRSLFKIF